MIACPKELKTKPVSKTWAGVERRCLIQLISLSLSSASSRQRKLNSLSKLGWKHCASQLCHLMHVQLHHLCEHCLGKQSLVQLRNGISKRKRREINIGSYHSQGGNFMNTVGPNGHAYCTAWRPVWICAKCPMCIEIENSPTTLRWHNNFDHVEWADNKWFLLWPGHWHDCRLYKCYVMFST